MSKVFEEVKLKHLTLKNRLVRSATQDPFGSPDGFVTDRQKELYRTIAANNVGMIITAHVCVTPEGRAMGVQNCFYDDSFVAGQAEVASVIKSNGGSTTDKPCWRQHRAVSRQRKAHSSCSCGKGVW